MGAIIRGMVHNLFIYYGLETCTKNIIYDYTTDCISITIPFFFFLIIIIDDVFDVKIPQKGYYGYSVEKSSKSQNDNK